jgi:hypothetical protein
MKTAAFILGLLVIVGTAMGQNVELELRLYDVSAITEARAHTYGVRLGHRGTSGDYEEMEEREPTPFLEVDAVADYIRETVEPNSWDAGGDVMGMEGGILAVKNRPAVHDKIREFIAKLAAAASQRIGFSVEVYELDDARYPTLKRDVLPKSEPQTAAMEVRRIESASGEAWPGVSTAVQVTNRVRFVRDYDVEIAQGSNISDPVVDFGTEGTVLELIARPTIDGKRLLVDVIVQHGRFDRPFRELELGIDEEYFAEPYRSDLPKNLGIMQLPTFRHSGVVMTRIVPAGGTFTIPIVSGGRTLVFQVKTKLLGSTPPGNILYTGALCHRPEKVYFGDPVEGEEDELARIAPTLHRGGDHSRFFTGTEELLDFIVQNVAPWYWEEGEASVGITERQDIHIKASDDITKAVRKFVMEFEAQQLRQVYFDLRVYSSGGAAALGPRDAFPAGTPVYAATVSTLPGRRASLQTGNTMNYLADYEVEVAQEARISDPIVAQSFEGMVADIQPRLTPDEQGVITKLKLLIAQRKHGEPFDSGTRFLGPLDRIEEHRAEIDTTVTIPTGKVFLLDAGANPAKPGERLLVAVRASRR